MFPGKITTGLSFAKILGGLSKALSVANQIIPIYNKAKPMIGNSKKILNILKGFSSENNLPSKTLVQNNEIKKTDNYSNLPVFFN